jgi:lipid II:glycine glycyltransferase (peptidoglycan interpeptide bridge formation enzyme)
MEWIIYKENFDEYEKYISVHPFSGVWHQPAWLRFQIECKKAVDGFVFAVKNNNLIVLAGIFLIYRSSAGFSYGYIPSGFLYTDLDRNIYDFFLKNLASVAKAKKIIYTQIDSIINYDENFTNIISKNKNHRLNVKLPIPQFTTIINLEKSEEEILSCMKPKGRYNIKLSDKKGVIIRHGDMKSFDDFYKILKDTAARDEFKTNSSNYYKKMLECIPDAKLITAHFDNKIIAGGIFIFTGRQALYYYGASSNDYRNLMAPYLIQWEAIKTAKSNGCKYFDFMGISDPADKKDRLKGVTEFKLKFGGDIIKFNPSFIIIHDTIKYNLINFLKKIIRRKF